MKKFSIIFLVSIALLFTLTLILGNRKIEVERNKRFEEQYAQLNIAGITLEAPRQEIDDKCFADMKRLNNNWVAFIPFAFGRKDQTILRYNATGQWWGETEKGIAESIKLAHRQNLKVMLKPQLWMSGGDYTGHFTLPTDSAWKEWEKNYTTYIILHAATAQKHNAEMFCIGTELDAAVKERPQFWSNLIDEIKKNYTGKLTYAANWGVYKEFKSWDKLDYVGIDAYFPIDTSITPSVDQLLKGWQPHFSDIKNFQAQINKPILFTEYGYRSIDKCAAEPWLSYNKMPVNMEAQQNAYEALYKTFSGEKWFAGGFLWKWHARDSTAGGLENTNFTPQNKPVEAVIKSWHNQK